MNNQSSDDVFKILQVDAIDAGDRLFASSPPWMPLGPLLDSVRQHGILSPLHVQKRPQGPFRIIMGFRRFRAALESSTQEIPCIVRAHQEGLSLFQQTVEENLASRGMCLIEKASVLAALRFRFGVAEQRVMDQFMSPLGIPADRFHLRRYLELSRLPESLQRGLLEGLEPDIVFKLWGWRASEQDFFLGLVRSYQLGKNKQKQLFSLLDELRASQHCGGESPKEGWVAQIWQSSGAAVCEQNQTLPPSQRFTRALSELHKFRFPSLAAHQSRYEELKRALQLPPELRFHAPRYFEGDRIDIAFSFRSQEELVRLARKLEAIAEREEVREILKLL